MSHWTPEEVMAASNKSPALLQAKGPPKSAVVEAVPAAGPQQIQMLMDEVTKQVWSL